MEFAFIRNLQSSGTSSAKKKDEGVQLAVQGEECERSGGGDRPSLNRFASGKQDRPFEGVWCKWDPLFARLGVLRYCSGL